MHISDRSLKSLERLIDQEKRNQLQKLIIRVLETINCLVYNATNFEFGNAFKKHIP